MFLRNRTIEMKWAFFFIIMMLLWMVMERLVGLHDVHIDQHVIYTNFIAIPAILIYFFALRDKREAFYKGKMTYTQGLASGLVITIIVTLLTPALQFTTSTFISPDYFQNASAYAIEHEMMSEAKAIEYFNLRNYVIQATLGALIMGIITSLLVALFTKKS
jgi:multisubunit Na+/H+ antiporter MnhB subunit